MKHIKKYNESKEGMNISKEDIDMFFYEFLDSDAESDLYKSKDTGKINYILILPNYKLNDDIYNNKFLDEKILNNYLNTLNKESNMISELISNIERLKQEYPNVRYSAIDASGNIGLIFQIN